MVGEGKVEEFENFILINKNWFKNIENSSIWYTAFKVVTTNAIEKKYELLEFDNLNCVIINGSLKYFRIQDNDIDVNFSEFILPSAEIKTTNEGIWLLFISPYIIDGTKLDEEQIKDRIKSYASLFSIVFGENVIYKQIFENIISCKTGIPTATSSTIINPRSNPNPIISTKNLLQVSDIVKAKNNLNQTLQNKVDSSLTWYYDSIKDFGTSSFLKCWIAIEILVLNDSNIKPIKEIFYKIYNESETRDNELFMIGKLYGIRGEIVHDGSKRPIHGLLLKYLQFIYIDIFYEILQLEPRYATQLLLDNIKLNLDDLINYNSES